LQIIYKIGFVKTPPDKLHCLFTLAKP